MVCFCVLQALTKGGVTYKDEVWHKECFLCTGCKAPLAGQPFTSQGESPYCVKCFSSLYAKKCAGCNTAITGQWRVRDKFLRVVVVGQLTQDVGSTLPGDLLLCVISNFFSVILVWLDYLLSVRQQVTQVLNIGSDLSGVVYIYPLHVLCCFFLLSTEITSQ